MVLPYGEFVHNPAGFVPSLAAFLRLPQHTLDISSVRPSSRKVCNADRHGWQHLTEGHLFKWRNIFFPEPECTVHGQTPA